MSRMRNRWLAIGLAALLAFPTNSMVVFAGQQTEVVAVSGNEAAAQEPGAETEAGTRLDGDEQTAAGEQTDAQGNLQIQGEDLDAETAVITTSYPLEIGVEKTLTNLKKNVTYYVQVTIPELKAGENQPYYRIKVDGKTIDTYEEHTSADKNSWYGHTNGFLCEVAGTYFLGIPNDARTEHTVCIEEVAIQSVKADFSGARLYANGDYNVYADLCGWNRRCHRR